MIPAEAITTVHAAIVTYEPSLSRLSENLLSVGQQVSRILLYDNGSSNVGDIRRLVGQVPNAVLIEDATNRGIAFALNRLAAESTKLGGDWLLTLDQDSVASEDLVATMLMVADDHGVEMLTPYIVDRNKMTIDEYQNLELRPVEFFKQGARRGAMTSGALTRLSVWNEVGGYDERFFIDYADNDFNQRMLLGGHRIARCNRTFLLHEVGRARATWLRVPRKDISGRWTLERFYAFGHNSQRCYYKARNRILFTRKHAGRIGITHEGVWQLPQLIALTLIFEGERRSKILAFYAGIRDGLQLPLD